MQSYDLFAWFYHEYWGREIPSQLLTALDKFFLPLLPARARVLDLCCGDGQLAAQLARRGFVVSGLDASAEMLAYARRSAPEVEWINADARSFDAPLLYDAVVSTFDSLNHFLSLKDLTQVFRNVRRALVDGGLFCFDVNLEKGFRLHWQECFSVVEADKVCVVRGGYDAGDKMGRYDFTLFRAEEDGERWRRSDFTIEERCYSSREIRAALKLAGFGRVKTYDAERDGGLADHAGRVFFLAE
ncbi:MAG: class I SAM-dependent methyltransferase [Pyrinomonadaceae bacterium]